MPRIDAPTTHVLARLLIQADGPAEYPAVHALQDGFVITPLSQWNLRRRQRVRADGALNMKVSPREQVESLPTDALFAYASELLRRNPPHAADQPVLARLRGVGLIPGRPFDFDKLDHPPNKACAGPAGRASACRPLPAPRARPMAGSGKRAASACTQCLHAPRAGRQAQPGASLPEDLATLLLAADGRASRGRLAPLSPALRQRPVAGRRLLVAGGLRRQGLLAPTR